MRPILPVLLDILVGHRDVDLATVARLTAQLSHSAGAIIFAVEPEAKTLRVAASYPVPTDVSSELRVPIGHGVAGRVAQTGHATTLLEDSPRTPALRALLQLADGEHVARMCLPCHGLGAEVVGVLSVHRDPAQAYILDELEMATSVADLIGLRMYAVQLRADAAHHRSERDQLIAQAISAQESERRRIAGDLHDGVTQVLASVAFHLSAAETSLQATQANSAILDQVRVARDLTGQAYDETRAAISGLHSLVLEDLGIEAAMRSLAQTSPGVDVDCRIDPESFNDLPDHTAAALYRIAQESLSNAVRHSEATCVVLSLRRIGNTVVLGVSDDGVGFDVEEARGRKRSSGEGMGLTSVAERCALIGANLRIESVAGRGTALIVELPLDTRFPDSGTID